MKPADPSPSRKPRVRPTSPSTLETHKRPVLYGHRLDLEKFARDWRRGVGDRKPHR